MFWQKINMFFLTAVIDVFIFLWSFYYAFFGLTYFGNQYLYLFLIGFGLFFFIFIFLDREVGTKLKHKRRSLMALETIAYIYSLAIGAISFSPGKSIFISMFGNASHIALIFFLNVFLFVFALRILVLKFLIWFKWGKLKF